MPRTIHETNVVFENEQMRIETTADGWSTTITHKGDGKVQFAVVCQPNGFNVHPVGVMGATMILTSGGGRHMVAFRKSSVEANAEK